MELLNTLLDSDPLRFFGIKLYDKDIFELLFRLGINLIASYFIIWKIYKATRKDSEYLFTYFVFSPVIFFVCHLFSKTELSIGFAFGLFAVFSILRYRTTTIPVKEMTYMFIVIAVAVINAITTKKVSYIELLFTNSFIVFFTYMLERFFHESGTFTQTITYETIENIRPENESLLLADIKDRTGKDVVKYDIVDADFVRDSAKIRIYYKKNKA